MNKPKVIQKLKTLLKERTYIHDDVALQLAEIICREIVEPEVENERNDWILLTKAAPNRPDGRGFDS